MNSLNVVVLCLLAALPRCACAKNSYETTRIGIVTEWGECMVLFGEVQVDPSHPLNDPRYSEVMAWVRGKLYEGGDIEVWRDNDLARGLSDRKLWKFYVEDLGPAWFILQQADVHATVMQFVGEQPATWEPPVTVGLIEEQFELTSAHNMARPDRKRTELHLHYGNEAAKVLIAWKQSVFSRHLTDGDDAFEFDETTGRIELGSRLSGGSIRFQRDGVAVFDDRARLYLAHGSESDLHLRTSPAGGEIERAWFGNRGGEVAVDASILPRLTESLEVSVEYGDDRITFGREDEALVISTDSDTGAAIGCQSGTVALVVSRTLGEPVSLEAVARDPAAFLVQCGSSPAASASGG